MLCCPLHKRSQLWCTLQICTLFSKVLYWPVVYIRLPPASGQRSMVYLTIHPCYTCLATVHCTSCSRYCSCHTYWTWVYQYAVALPRVQIEFCMSFCLCASNLLTALKSLQQYCTCMWGMLQVGEICNRRNSSISSSGNRCMDRLMHSRAE